MLASSTLITLILFLPTITMFPQQLSEHHELMTNCVRQTTGEPCSCKVILTSIAVQQQPGNRLTNVEFFEASCNDKVNKKREEFIHIGYSCKPIRSEKTLYTNAEGTPIQPVKIFYTVGCELRCSEECRKTQTPSLISDE